MHIEDRLLDILVAELVGCFADPEQARGFLQSLAWSAEHIPELHEPEDFWRAVLRLASDVDGPTGAADLVRALAVRFPDNPVLARIGASDQDGPRYRLQGEGTHGGEARESTELYDSAGASLDHGEPADSAREDHLWDTGPSASLERLGRGIAVTTQGSALIVGGRVRHKQRPIIGCPDCDGPLEPATVTVRFTLAPSTTADQSVPGHRCVTCGSLWPEPSAMRDAHRIAHALPRH